MNRKIFRSIGLLVLTLLLLTTAAFATSSLSAHCILPPIEGTATSEDSGIKEVDGSNAKGKSPILELCAGGKVWKINLA